jgi:hypothetical protein
LKTNEKPHKMLDKGDIQHYKSDGPRVICRTIQHLSKVEIQRREGKEPLFCREKSS